MIRILASGGVVDAKAAEILAAEFEETGCAMLPGFLSPAVLKVLTRQLANARFEMTEEVVKANGRVFGNTLKMPPTDPAIVGLNFILNDPLLFDVVSRVAKCLPIYNFVGRLHRTSAGTDQHIDWHDDKNDFRIVGLDVNLSQGDYEGGLFQVRGPDRRVTREIKNWKQGDAFLFKIGDGWQHRLTPVESGERTVGVGWYRSQPDPTIPDWRLILESPEGLSAFASRMTT